MRLPRLFHWLKPSRTIPLTPWTATHPWQISFTRLSVLITGLAIFGFGDAMIISSGLGNAPWSVLAQGLSIRLGTSIGIATVLVGALVLLFWIPLKRRIGLGTILNILVISIFIDIGMHLLPHPEGDFLALIFVLGGTALIGLGSSLYLTCGLGPGPRDGLMTGIHERTGVRIGRVRLTLELIVLVAGALLGGSWGLGTALFALLIGQSVAVWLGVVSRATSK